MPIHDWTKADPGVFHYLHLRWIGTLCDALNDGRLPPDYYAIGEQRSPGLRFEPDVLALQQGDTNGTATPPVAGQRAGLLTAPPKASVIAESDVDAYRRKQNSVVVRHASGDRVVAIIEIVSPGNKSSRKAIRSFMDKATAFLEREIHFLFVDLFPPTSLDPLGLHAIIWNEMTGQEYELPSDKPLCAAAYESGSRLRTFVEPLAVGDQLPTMPLFIESEAYVNVPLETTYQAAFNALPARFRGDVSSAG